MGKPNEKLKALRGRKTQAQVAKDLGITASAYAQYERGDRVPRDDIKKAIAEYYDSSIAYLFFSD
jgi:transcriptional regulator with XRE-family HTH domain